MALSLPQIVIKLDIVTLLYRDFPLFPLALNLRNNEVYVFTIAFSLPNIVIKPDLLTLFHRDRPLCAPLTYDSGTPKYLCGLMGP